MRKPSFSRGKPAPAGPAVNKKRAPGTSLRQFSLGIMIIMALVVLGALFLLQLNFNATLTQQRTILSGSVAEQEADRIAAHVSGYVLGLTNLARDPALQQELASNDRAALQRREERLRYVFPGALRVRLLAPGQDRVDTSQSPHLGYACLDLLHQAERGTEPPGAEVHVLGTPQQHIGMVQAVRGANGKLLGDIQLTLDVRLLQGWLGDTRSKGFMELTQGIPGGQSLVLTTTGDKALQSQGEHFGVPVEGTRWQLEVWIPPASSSGLLGFWGVYGAAILLLTLAVYLLFRILGRILKADVVSLMQLTRDVLQGTKRYEQPLRLREVKAAALMLSRLPPATTLQRERDRSDIFGAKPAPFQVRDDVDTGPMFRDKQGVMVEELAENPFAPRDEPAIAEVRPATAAPAGRSGPNAASSAAGGPLASEIFKAYDIRGIVGQTLTADGIYQIGRALGSIAAEQGIAKIAFARDGRLSGPELGGALVRGLREAGRDVLDIGQAPTPVLYYAASEMAGGSGVMLTGSHNPPQYNGLKMMLAGDTLAGDTIQAIKRRIEARELAGGQGAYETANVLGDYIERITSDVKLKRRMKVAVDCGNGVAGLVAPKLLRALGCDLVELYCDVDGNFPNHHPDPSQPENLQALIRAVKEQRAELGLAFDGDGDRLGVVSGDGSVIWPDRQMMLYAGDVLSRNPGATIIFDVKCTTNLARAIAKHGGRPLMWRTGHSLIKAKMKEIGAPLAGEMSGHIFFKDRWYGFDDALYTAARLLEILAGDVRQPRVVFASLPDTVNTPELRLDMAEGSQHEFMDRLLAAANFDNGLVTAIDGLRVDFEDGYWRRWGFLWE